MDRRLERLSLPVMIDMFCSNMKLNRGKLWLPNGRDHLTLTNVTFYLSKRSILTLFFKARSNSS